LLCAVGIYILAVLPGYKSTIIKDIVFQDSYSVLAKIRNKWNGFSLVENVYFQ
jgi:hypothetical protein